MIESMKRFGQTQILFGAIFTIGGLFAVCFWQSAGYFVINRVNLAVIVISAANLIVGLATQLLPSRCAERHFIEICPKLSAAGNFESEKDVMRFCFECRECKIGDCPILKIPKPFLDETLR